jgi:MFS family permease
MRDDFATRLRHHHDFTLLWIGQTISELGTRVSMFAFPLVTYAVTGSAWAAALVQAAELVGLATMLLPAGVLADRVDRRRLLRAASALGALAYACLTITVILGHAGVVPLLAAALCSGVAAGLFGPAELSAVRSVVPQADLPAALSLNQGRQHVAALVGGPLGGLLYGVALALPFAVDAGSYLFSWALLGRLRADLSPPATPRPRGSALADLREGVAYVRRHPLLRVLAAWSFLTNLSMNALFLVAVLRMITDGVKPLHIGLVETVAGMGGVLGALLAPRLIAHVPTGLLTIVIAWSAVPLVIPIAVWGDPVVVAAALGAVLLLNPAGNAGMQSYRAAVTPTNLVGRVQAVMTFSSVLSLPLAPVLAGGLLALLGGRNAVLLAGVACALVALVPTVSRAVRAIPRPDEWPKPDVETTRTCSSGARPPMAASRATVARSAEVGQSAPESPIDAAFFRDEGYC